MVLSYVPTKKKNGKKKNRMKTFRLIYVDFAKQYWTSGNTFYNTIVKDFIC